MLKISTWKTVQLKQTENLNKGKENIAGNSKEDRLIAECLAGICES